MNKIIRIDMTSQVIREEEPTKEFITLGGRAFIDHILTNEVEPTVHPLSSGNKLVFAPGFFAGTSIPSSGRLSVGGKSPLTYGIKEANGGGTFSTKIARLGIKALIIEGQASDGLFVMVIKKELVSLEQANDLKGLGNYEVCSILRDRYGNNVGIASIGPCGEMLMSASTIAITDMKGFPVNHCARGGLGAVMGSKGLKAIVVDDTGGVNQKPVIPGEFNEAVKESVDFIKNHTRASLFTPNGSSIVVAISNQRGSLPTRNYRLGSFDKVEGLTSQRMAALQEKRGGTFGQPCMPGCIVKCSNVYFNENKEYLTASFEYETMVLLGSNLEIDDMDAVASMDRRCDDYGLDTIETGSTLGVLAETGLFKFGDKDRAISLIDEIGRGSVLGKILGQGVAITCRVFGISRVPAVKGQALPGHSAQSLKGLAVTYATSPQGADHTAGFLADDPLSPNGQVERSRNAQLNALLMDSAGLCYYSFLSGNLANVGLFAKLINSLYGVNYDEEIILNMVKNALKEEIAFNRRAGISEADDRLPEFIKRDPLPPTNAVFDVPESEVRKIFELL